MRVNRYLKSGKVAFMGLIVTGGWLLADLLLPEPWGDYLLFTAMAVVNVSVGWKLGTLSEKRESSTADSQTVDARSTVNSEI